MTETPARGARVDKKNLAGNWVRAAAFGLDWIIVSAIVSSGEVLKVNAGDTPAAKHPAAFSDLAALSVQQYGINWFSAHLPLFQEMLPHVLDFSVGFVCIFLYAAVLVALVGRTFGMMVLGLRVVRPDYRPVGAARAAWRYFVNFMSMAFVLPMFGFLWRPALQDRITGTRVVRGSFNP